MTAYSSGKSRHYGLIRSSYGMNIQASHRELHQGVRSFPLFVPMYFIAKAARRCGNIESSYV